jgi:hypothetical protein
LDIAIGIGGPPVIGLMVCVITVKFVVFAAYLNEKLLISPAPKTCTLSVRVGAGDAGGSAS